MIVRFHVCDVCRRPALRPYRSGGRVFCPNCALNEASDLIRAGRAVAFKPVRTGERPAPVAELAQVFDYPSGARGRACPADEAPARRAAGARPRGRSVREAGDRLKPS